MKIFDKFPYFCRCSAGDEKSHLVFIQLYRIFYPLQWKQRCSDQEGRNNYQSQLPDMNSTKSHNSGFPPQNLTSHSQGDGWQRAVIPSDTANLCCLTCCAPIEVQQENLGNIFTCYNLAKV